MIRISFFAFSDTVPFDKIINRLLNENLPIPMLANLTDDPAKTVLAVPTLSVLMIPEFIMVAVSALRTKAPGIGVESKLLAEAAYPNKPKLFCPTPRQTAANAANELAPA